MVALLAWSYKKNTAFTVVLLVVYFSFVLSVTLISRVPSIRPRYNLKLFWSVEAALAGRKYLAGEILANTLMFVPAGAVLAWLLRKRKLWFPMLAGMLLSMSIEVVQLFSKRGYFEFDDIFFNTLGCVIGVFAILPVRKYCRIKAQDSVPWSTKYKMRNIGKIRETKKVILY